jgi:RNA polymerase sigma-70 factor, ECF subfamily
VTEQLIELAQHGDEDAFGALVAPFRRELHVHCYRILGSLHEAEDAVQETLLAAWRGMGTFERRSSFRGWLYAVATNRCLNMLRAASRRPRTAAYVGFEPQQPAEPVEPLWLEPYPDVDLDETPAHSPAARYEAKESLSLAFVMALQLLPARQRATLILRDVLGFRAAEVAAMLETTEESVTSALKRARATLDRALPRTEPPPAPHSPEERDLVARLTDAFVANDVDGIVALLVDDVRLSMPPLPLEYRGLDQAARFFHHVAPLHRDCRVSHTRANGQPALVVYTRDPSAPVYRAVGLLVLTLTAGRVAAITRFDPGLLSHFGLPRTVPA